MSFHPQPNRLSTWWTVLAPVCLALSYYLVNLKYTSLPQPLMGGDCIEHPARFCAENSMRWTNQLSSLGPRVTGSAANEVQAVQFIVGVIDELIVNSVPGNHIEYEVQKASSNVYFADRTSVYQGIQNVVVRFTPAGVETNGTILVNTHFDSIAMSPGAGDAAIMVSVMLETLRVLSQTQARSDGVGHTIVFLFNGANINGMHGSHAFITMHRWAENVRMVVNLDSVGNGGRDMLFKVSPNAQWLTHWYVRSAVHPFATCTSRDLEDAGLYLMRTGSDYDMLWLYGQIPSLDFTLPTNGYIHHTDHDVPSAIPDGTYQNIGDNLLSLCKDTAQFGRQNGYFDVIQNDHIYFDYLGLFMIHYQMDKAILVNITSSAVTLALIIVAMTVFSKYLDLGIKRMGLEFLEIFSMQLTSILLALASILILATIYDAVGGSMRWFSNTWLIGLIYYCPTIIVMLMCPVIFLRWKQGLARSEAYVLTLPAYVQLCQHAHCCVVIVFTWFLTGFHVRSAFIAVMLVIFYGLALLLNLMFKLVLAEKRWIFVHLICHLPGFVYLTYCSIFLLDIYVPVLGRESPTENPDIVIALFCGCICIGQLGLITPMIVFFRRPSIVIAVLTGIFVAGLICMSTPMGFPYRPSESEKRFDVYHTKQIVHDVRQSPDDLNYPIRRSDSGYLMYAKDRQGSDFIKEMHIAKDPTNNCATELMCGLPLQLNEHVLDSSKWIPANEPTLFEPPLLKLVNVTSIQTDILRYNFILKGPSHMDMVVSPAPGFRLTEWSISELPWKGRHLWDSRSQYSVHFSYGSNNSPFVFSIDFRVPTSSSVPYTMDIAVTTKCIWDEHQRTSEYQYFLRQFPGWTYVMPCISSYESWKI